MLRLRVLFSLIALMLACSKPKPHIVEVDEDFERNLKMRQSEAEAIAEQNSIVLLLEDDKERNKEMAYRKNPQTVPEKYLLRDPRKPSPRHAQILWISCDRDACDLRQIFAWHADEINLGHVPRSSLTWLASTDLLGLPVEQGGRKPLPPDEEGRQLRSDWSPFTRDNCPPEGCGCLQ